MRLSRGRWLWQAIIVLGALVLGLAGCSRETLIAQESYVFGTRVEVLVWSADRKGARAAIGEVLRDFDRLHRRYHAWQPSDLSAINEAFAQGKTVAVDDEMSALILEAQAFAARSDHLFDPGIGRLVALWGFHDDNFAARLPDSAALAALRRRMPSIAQVRLQDRQAASRNAAVALDFGGYLKGVALDRAAATLKGAGLPNALINIGGNVMALGSKDGQPWRVGIQHPRGPGPMASLDLRDGEAIGTSGDYQRYFELDGRRYSHLIDPRTGEPATGTQAVTVLIPPQRQAGLWSDAASKPLFIAGADWQGQAQRLGLTQVLRVAADGRVQVTAALGQRLQWDAPVSPETVP